MADEVIDILDEQGNLIGESMLKSEAHARGLWHYAGHIWVFNSKGEVLIQKRALKMSYPGLWDISAAGHVAAGEDPTEAALREMEEEIGLKTDKRDLIFLGIRKIKEYQGASFDNREHAYVFIFRFDGKLSDLKLQKEEVEELKFIPLDEFEREVKDTKTASKYVPHGKLFDEVIEAIRKQLKSS